MWMIQFYIFFNFCPDSFRHHFPFMYHKTKEAYLVCSKPLYHWKCDSSLTPISQQRTAPFFIEHEGLHSLAEVVL